MRLVNNIISGFRLIFASGSIDGSRERGREEGEGERTRDAHITHFNDMFDQMQR